MPFDSQQQRTYGAELYRSLHEHILGSCNNNITDRLEVVYNEGDTSVPFKDFERLGDDAFKVCGAVEALIAPKGATERLILSDAAQGNLTCALQGMRDFGQNDKIKAWLEQSGSTAKAGSNILTTKTYDDMSAAVTFMADWAEKKLTALDNMQLASQPIWDIDDLATAIKLADELGSHNITTVNEDVCEDVAPVTGCAWRYLETLVTESELPNSDNLGYEDLGDRLMLLTNVDVLPGTKGSARYLDIWIKSTWPGETAKDRRSSI